MSLGESERREARSVRAASGAFVRSAAEEGVRLFISAKCASLFVRDAFFVSLRSFRPERGEWNGRHGAQTGDPAGGAVQRHSRRPQADRRHGNADPRVSPSVPGPAGISAGKRGRRRQMGALFVHRHRSVSGDALQEQDGHLGRRGAHGNLRLRRSHRAAARADARFPQPDAGRASPVHRRGDRLFRL